MDLFSEQTSLPTNASLHIEAPLTKDQTAFNNLIKKIELKRAKLAEWEAAIPVFQQRYASDLQPLQTQALALQVQLVHALDVAHGEKGLTKGERKKLAAVIVDLACSVLEAKEDDTIKALYNKHSQSDFDAEQADEEEHRKAMLEAIFGVDLGDDVDMNHPDEVLQRVQEQFRNQPGGAPADELRERKKTAKQQARDEKLAAEESQMSQSIREVYRKLASALHPDREPDAEERLRKTSLMQRANAAYDKGNLLQLLELQLELEHIDQAHLAGLSAERMKHYLKILKGQLNELEGEIFHIQERFSLSLNVRGVNKIQPSGVMTMLRNDVVLCEGALRRLQQQVDATNSLALLKDWLKTIKLVRHVETDFDYPF